MTPAVQRILRTYDQDPEHGATWYQDALAWCEVTGVLPGVVAALSPQTGWEDNLDRAYRLTHHGERKGIRLFVDRAQAIIDGADPLDVLGGNKVRSFYRNIADPYDPTPVTIDRHAWAIAHPRKPIKHLDRKGEYERVADHYREAAHERGVLPHVMQSVTWSNKRGSAA